MVVLCLMVAVGGYGLLILGLMSVMAYRLFRYPRENPGEAQQARRDRGEIPPDWEDWGWVLWEFATSRGRIRGLWAPGSGPGAAVFLPGSGTDFRSMIKYMAPFRARGFSLATWDWLGSGASEPGRLTFGFREGPETLDLLRFLREAHPQIRFWGLYGESLGGALALEVSGLWTETAFVVADCPFSDFREECRHLMRRSLGPFGRWAGSWITEPALAGVEGLTAVLGGYRLGRSEPLDMARASGLRGMPLLLFHGADDRYVPPDHSRRIVEQRNPEKTWLVEVPGARHAKSWRIDPPGYRARVEKFLDEELIWLGKSN